MEQYKDVSQDKIIHFFKNSIYNPYIDYNDFDICKFFDITNNWYKNIYVFLNKEKNYICNWIIIF